MLLLLLAAYCVTRAIEDAGTRWLVWAGVFVGLGFLTKMLAAWIVLPGLALAYFVAAPGSRGRRLARIGLAGVVTLAVSLSWPVAVSLWPGAKPFVGSTTDGSVWQLAFGYNGLTRLVGGATGIGGGYGATVGAALGGGPGPMRLFDAEVGGQIAWLLPLALVSLVVAACRARGAAPFVKAGWALWGGWLVVGAGVFSFTGGIFHAYYTAELAPAIAALAAAGLVTAWRWFRAGGPARFVLPAAVAGTAVLRLRPPRPDAGLGAVAAVHRARAGVARRRRGAPACSRRRGRGRAGRRRRRSRGLRRRHRGAAGQRAGDGRPGCRAAVDVRVAHRRRHQHRSGRRGRVRPVHGRVRTGSSAGQREVLAYAQAQAPSAEVVLAVEGGTYGADPFLLNTDARVAPLGGYLGFDPAPSAADLPRWVSAGKLRFVLLPQVFLDIGRGGSKQRTEVAVGDAGELTRRIGWEAKHCRPVPPARIGADAATAGVLFDCGGLRP